MLLGAMGSTPVIRVYQRGIPVLAGTLASNTVGTGDIAGSDARKPPVGAAPADNRAACSG